MAFPTVSGSERTANTDTTQAAEHTITFPTGMTNGNLLLMGVFSDGFGETFTGIPSGFTSLIGPTATVGCTSQFYYKEIESGDTGDWTLTISSAERKMVVFWEISGAADPATTPPEAEVASATTADPSPPLLTPGFGTQDAWWLSFVSHAHGGHTLDTYPTNMDDYTVSVTHGSSSGLRIGIAEESQNVSSFTPNDFAFSSSDANDVFTIAVPSTAAASGDPFIPYHRRKPRLIRSRDIYRR